MESLRSAIQDFVQRFLDGERKSANAREFKLAREEDRAAEFSTMMKALGIILDLMETTNPNSDSTMTKTEIRDEVRQMRSQIAAQYKAMVFNNDTTASYLSIINHVAQYALIYGMHLCGPVGGLSFREVKYTF